MLTEKKCTRCGGLKPEDSFSPRSDRPGSRLSRCRLCVNEAQNARRNASEESRAASCERRRGDWAKLSPERKLADGRSRNMKHKAAQKFIHHKVRTGKWPKASVCILCESTENIHWHHDDYAYQEEVIELCARTCHPMADRAMRDRQATVA